MRMKRVSCLLLSFLMLVVMIQVPGSPAFAKDKDNSAPVVMTDTIKVDKSTAEREETVTISLRINDESEIASATLWFIGDGLYDDYGVGIYNSETGLWDFQVDPRYFGKNEIKWIRVQDVYSNYMEYYNSASSRVNKDFSDPHSKYVDLSGGDFTVSNGSYAKESDPPEINLNSLSVSDTKPSINDKVYFKVKIKDSSPVACTYFDYAYSSAVLRSYGEYDPVSGYYQYEVACSNYGAYEPLILTAEDAFGNEITYVDEDQSYMETYPNYKGVSGIAARLKAANFTVQGGQKDITPPTLDPSSFKVDKIYLERSEQTIVSFKASDDTGIDCYNTVIRYGGLGGPIATSCSYNSKSERYEVLVSSDIYGTHQIFEIELSDKYGNKRDYLDEGSEIFKAYGFVPEEGYNNTDLSGSIFYVGIENADTGTFVSNSTMDETTRLKVKDLQESGDAYDALKQKGYNVKEFYDVNVQGACDMTSEKTKVFFDVPRGFSDGDKLKIRHLLSDGTIQTRTATVIDGKVGLDVNEFSPFMLVVKKSKDKNLFTKNGLTYQVTGNSTVTFVKHSNNCVTSVVIPATVKANGKTYKVTRISDNALKNCKKLKTLTIGKNVSKIGKYAFYNCKKLKTLTIKTTKLTSSKVGKNAFKGVPRKVKLKLPSKKSKAYKKLLKNRGLGK